MKHATWRAFRGWSVAAATAADGLDGFTIRQDHLRAIGKLLEAAIEAALAVPGGAAGAAATRAQCGIHRAIADIAQLHRAAYRAELDEQAGRAAITPGTLSVGPVSYTHLTLPTIYSV